MLIAALAKRARPLMRRRNPMPWTDFRLLECSPWGRLAILNKALWDNMARLGFNRLARTLPGHRLRRAIAH
jgi:hypothetical protein